MYHKLGLTQKAITSIVKRVHYVHRMSGLPREEAFPIDIHTPGSSFMFSLYKERKSAFVATTSRPCSGQLHNSKQQPMEGLFSTELAEPHLEGNLASLRPFPSVKSKDDQPTTQLV